MSFGVCPGVVGFILPPVKSFAPIPPTRARRALFPRWGRGRTNAFLCKGLRPLHPRGRTRAALFFRAVAVSPNSCRERYCVPGGFRHRKPPVSQQTSRRRRRGAGGEAPGKINLKSPPSPAWEERSASAGRGMGARKICEVGANRRRQRQAPLPVLYTAESAGNAGASPRGVPPTARNPAPPQRIGGRLLTAARRRVIMGIRPYRTRCRGTDRPRTAPANRTAARRRRDW